MSSDSGYIGIDPRDRLSPDAGRGTNHRVVTSTLREALFFDRAGKDRLALGLQGLFHLALFLSAGSSSLAGVHLGLLAALTAIVLVDRFYLQEVAALDAEDAGNGAATAHRLSPSGYWYIAKGKRSLLLLSLSLFRAVLLWSSTLAAASSFSSPDGLQGLALAKRVLFLLVGHASLLALVALRFSVSARQAVLSSSALTAGTTVALSTLLLKLSPSFPSSSSPPAAVFVALVVALLLAWAVAVLRGFERLLLAATTTTTTTMMMTRTTAAAAEPEQEREREQEQIQLQQGLLRPLKDSLHALRALLLVASSTAAGPSSTAAATAGERGGTPARRTRKKRHLPLAPRHQSPREASGLEDKDGDEEEGDDDLRDALGLVDRTVALVRRWEWEEGSEGLTTATGTTAAQEQEEEEDLEAQPLAAQDDDEETLAAQEAVRLALQARYGSAAPTPTPVAVTPTRRGTQGEEQEGKVGGGGERGGPRFFRYSPPSGSPSNSDEVGASSSAATLATPPAATTASASSSSASSSLTGRPPPHPLHPARSLGIALPPISTIDNATPSPSPLPPNAPAEVAGGTTPSSRGGVGGVGGGGGGSHFSRTPRTPRTPRTSPLLASPSAIQAGRVLLRAALGGAGTAPATTTTFPFPATPKAPTPSPTAPQQMLQGQSETTAPAAVADSTPANRRTTTPTPKEQHAQGPSPLTTAAAALAATAIAAGCGSSPSVRSTPGSATSRRGGSGNLPAIAEERGGESSSSSDNDNDSESRRQKEQKEQKQRGQPGQPLQNLSGLTAAISIAAPSSGSSSASKPSPLRTAVSFGHRRAGSKEEQAKQQGGAGEGVGSSSSPPTLNRFHRNNAIKNVKKRWKQEKEEQEHSVGSRLMPPPSPNLSVISAPAAVTAAFAYTFRAGGQPSQPGSKAHGQEKQQQHFHTPGSGANKRSHRAQKRLASRFAGVPKRAILAAEQQEEEEKQRRRNQNQGLFPQGQPPPPQPLPAGLQPKKHAVGASAALALAAGIDEEQDDSKKQKEQQELEQPRGEDEDEEEEEEEEFPGDSASATSPSASPASSPLSSPYSICSTCGEPVYYYQDQDEGGKNEEEEGGPEGDGANLPQQEKHPHHALVAAASSSPSPIAAGIAARQSQQPSSQPPQTPSFPYSQISSSLLGGPPPSALGMSLSPEAAAAAGSPALMMMMMTAPLPQPLALPSVNSSMALGTPAFASSIDSSTPLLLTPATATAATPGSVEMADSAITTAAVATANGLYGNEAVAPIPISAREAILESEALFDYGHEREYGGLKGGRKKGGQAAELLAGGAGGGRGPDARGGAGTPGPAAVSHFFRGDGQDALLARKRRMGLLPHLSPPLPHTAGLGGTRGAATGPNGVPIRPALSARFAGEGTTAAAGSSGGFGFGDTAAGANAGASAGEQSSTSGTAAVREALLKKGAMPLATTVVRGKLTDLSAVLLGVHNQPQQQSTGGEARGTAEVVTAASPVVPPSSSSSSSSSQGGGLSLMRRLSSEDSEEGKETEAGGGGGGGGGGEGGGSVIMARLPSVGELRARMLQARGAAAAGGGLGLQPPQSLPKFNLNVLVADDERVNLKIASRYLKQLGCASTCVEDGEDVVGALVLSERPFDCILLDIVMTRSNGLDIARQLRDQHVEIPLIAATANFSVKEKAAYSAAGFDRVLTKPFTIQDLAAALAFVANVQIQRGFGGGGGGSSSSSSSSSSAPPAASAVSAVTAATAAGLGPAAMLFEQQTKEGRGGVFKPFAPSGSAVPLSTAAVAGAAQPAGSSSLLSSLPSLLLSSSRADDGHERVGGGEEATR